MDFNAGSSVGRRWAKLLAASGQLHGRHWAGSHGRRHLISTGAREVMVLGSVARGDTVPNSDVDLVVIPDDLDYQQRRSDATRLKDLADQFVDVYLTDIPEWTGSRPT